MIRYNNMVLVGSTHTVEEFALICQHISKEHGEDKTYEESLDDSMMIHELGKKAYIDILVRKFEEHKSGVYRDCLTTFHGTGFPDTEEEFRKRLEKEIEII